MRLAVADVDGSVLRHEDPVRALETPSTVVMIPDFRSMRRMVWLSVSAM